MTPSLSTAVFRCLQYIASQEPRGVTLWPLGVEGLSRATRLRCESYGFTRNDRPHGSLVMLITHLTETGKRALADEIARREVAAAARRRAMAGVA